MKKYTYITRFNDCGEFDGDKNATEVQEFIDDTFYDMGKELLVITDYTDIAHAHKKPRSEIMDTYDFIELITECVDNKNGYDIIETMDNIYQITVYGSSYSYDGETWYTIEKRFTVYPAE